MGQVTIYLDENTEQAMRTAAQSAKVSQSKWIAQLIQEKAGQEWPEEVIALAGAWSDFPTAEEIRKPHPKDIKRHSL